MSDAPQLPAMYHGLASWFHLVTSPDEYAVEAGFYAGVMTESARIPVREVLELGSGGGNNASHLKARFELTLADVSEEMLSVSRALNPECTHVQGDMRTIRLGRSFDAVFVHDAVMYLTTEDDLAAAMRTAFEHCRPGGAAVFAPDVVRETLVARTDHGGHDGPDRCLRYLEWIWDPDPADDTFVADYAYLLKDADGRVHVDHDRHVCGVFRRSTWLRLLTETGFHAHRRDGIEDETGPDVFVGIRPLRAT
ncbi:MAG TPA: class I SAM-dependent methyltransferase [Actinomycetota bacterium]|nr:class I SAM-dependent methyltransferase [Actinomycetota bacterium]